MTLVDKTIVSIQERITTHVTNRSSTILGPTWEGIPKGSPYCMTHSSVAFFFLGPFSTAPPHQLFLDSFSATPPHLSLTPMTPPSPAPPIALLPPAVEATPPPPHCPTAPPPAASLPPPPRTLLHMELLAAAPNNHHP
jgi:hypothetical protein